MERINETDLNALVPQQQGMSVTPTPLRMSPEKSALILRWLQLAARQHKEELTEEDIAFWLRSLSSFSLRAIDWSFDDYLAHEVDEWGKSWMPKVPQIRKRCVEYEDRHAGPPPDSDLSQRMAKWREEEKSHATDPGWQEQYNALKERLKRV